MHNNFINKNDLIASIDKIYGDGYDDGVKAGKTEILNELMIEVSMINRTSNAISCATLMQMLQTRRDNEDKKYMNNKENVHNGETKIKKTLIEAKRYNGIHRILVDCTDLRWKSYAVDAYIGKNCKIKTSVERDDVAKEALLLLNFINGEVNIEKDVLCFCLSNLHKFVKSRLSQMTNNYVVSISHGQEPTIEIEYIKEWMILDNLISCLNTDGDWSIPDGWKRR